MTRTLTATKWIALLTVSASAAPLFAQATARACVAGEAAETPGPACLLASVPVGTIAKPIYWHIDQFVTEKAAGAARTDHGTIVNAYGKTWLFTLARKDWHASGGQRMARIGPLPVEVASDLTAEYLRSVFAPGQTAPLHVHSGPEAFYAMTGGTCLETPDGVRKATGPNNVLMIRAGPPMLLKAIGNEPRRGFALILHGAGLPPTTLIHDWMPKGLCDQ